MPRLLLTLIEKERLADELYRLRLIPAASQTIDFLPGQYMSIAVSGPVRRSYSIANSPAENSYFETYADTSPGGPGSLFIRNAAVGTQIDTILPLGKFNYAPGTEPVLFCATGSGVVPLLSMIKYELGVLKSGRQLSLYLGAREPTEVIEHTALTELSQKYPNFHYFPHLSQSDVLGSRGRITESIAALANLANSVAYICGAPDMIKDVEAILVSKGITSDNILYERYY